MLRIEATSSNDSPNLLKSRPGLDFDNVVTGTPAKSELTLDDLWRKGLAEDPVPRKTLASLKAGHPRSLYLTLRECREDRNGRLVYRERLYVPDYTPLKLRIIRDHHDTPAVGHPGRAKTLELIARNYIWPGIRKDVDRFVRNYYPC